MIYEFVKRLLDVSLGLFLVIVLSPLMLSIALLIWMDDSRGGLIFYQKRIGKGGKEFNMYKFRTMVTNADEIKPSLSSEVDGPVFKVKNDPRVTKVGRVLRKWSLDETPQLFNVLFGNMTLVGPRPLEDKEMTENMEWKETRLKVKPGMTGLWQIKGRGTGQFADWVTYDCQYVRERSILLDLKILFLTAGAVLKRRGAC
ncbi:sugar transferase [Candidatus Magnetomonas plexicatena]|uniref:sugar transferase n=1 Tax=Candidatus Magnetomonas plexicatena TaxID=2552947 RepID=UPI0011003971|nr:sugar transferase [Nitrospirales bacterium LBB_01]